MQNIIESFMVSLGFDVSQTGLRKFEQALKDSAGFVEHYSKRTEWQLGKFAGEIVKWQAAILGGFTGISGGILAVGARAAAEDQRFRLLGMRMFTTMENARKLQLIMDTLGQPLENLIWDKELHERALAMGADIDKMSKQIGRAHV